MSKQVQSGSQDESSWNQMTTGWCIFREGARERICDETEVVCPNLRVEEKVLSSLAWTFPSILGGWMSLLSAALLLPDT